MNDTCIPMSGVPTPPPRKEGLASLMHRFVQGLSVMIHRSHQSDCIRCVKDKQCIFMPKCAFYNLIGATRGSGKF